MKLIYSLNGKLWQKRKKNTKPIIVLFVDIAKI